jgi:hypothetical protein
MLGEDGFKYAGMSPEMLVKVFSCNISLSLDQVNEFATGLREGKFELPLDDRSAILLKENRSSSFVSKFISHRKLKEDIKILTLKNERYELELSGGNGQLPQQVLEMMSQVTGNRHSDEEYSGY